MMRRAYLHLNSWAGHTKHLVTIIRETPKRYEIELRENCIKGRIGKIITVPKYAVHGAVRLSIVHNSTNVVDVA